MNSNMNPGEILRNLDLVTERVNARLETEGLNKITTSACLYVLLEGLSIFETFDLDVMQEGNPIKIDDRELNG